MQARQRLSRLGAVFVAVMVAALAPSPAAADQPVREGLPAAPFTLDASSQAPPSPTPGGPSPAGASPAVTVQPVATDAALRSFAYAPIGLGLALLVIVTACAAWAYTRWRYRNLK